MVEPNMATKMTLQLETTKAENQKLNMNLQAKQLELDRSISFQKTTESRCVLLQGEIKAFNVTMEKQNEKHAKAALDAKSEIDFLRSQRSALEDKLTHYEIDAESKDKTITSLQDLIFRDKQKARDEMATMREAAKKTSAELSQLRATVLQNETHMSVIKSMHRDSDANMAAMETATIDNRKKTRDIGVVLKNKQIELEFAQERSKALQQKLEEIKTELIASQFAKENVDQKLVAATDELKVALTQIPVSDDEEKADVVLEEDPLTEAMQEIKTLHQQMFTLGQKHSDELKQVGLTKKKSAEEIRLLKASLFRADSELSSLKSISKASEDTIAGLEMTTSKIEIEIQKRISDTEKRAVDAEALVETHEREIESLKEASHKVRTDFDSQVGRIQERLSSSQAEVSVLGEMMDSANKVVSKMKTQITMYEKQLSHVAGASSECDDNISDTSTDVDVDVDVDDDADVDVDVDVDANDDVDVDSDAVTFEKSTDKTSVGTPWTFERRLLKERSGHLKDIAELNVQLRESKVNVCELAYKKESLEAVMHLLREEILTLRKLLKLNHGNRLKMMTPTPIEKFLSETEKTERAMKIKARLFGSSAAAPDLKSFFLGTLGQRVVKARYSADFDMNTSLSDVDDEGNLLLTHVETLPDTRVGETTTTPNNTNTTTDNNNASNNNNVTKMHGFSYEEGTHCLTNAMSTLETTTPTNHMNHDALRGNHHQRKLNFDPDDPMLSTIMMFDPTSPTSTTATATKTTTTIPARGDRMTTNSGKGSTARTKSSKWDHIKSKVYGTNNTTNKNNKNNTTNNTNNNNNNNNNNSGSSSNGNTNNSSSNSSSGNINNNSNHNNNSSSNYHSQISTSTPTTTSTPRKHIIAPPPQHHRHRLTPTPTTTTTTTIDNNSSSKVTKDKKEAVPSWKLAHQESLRVEREQRRKNRESWSKRKTRTEEYKATKERETVTIGLRGFDDVDDMEVGWKIDHEQPLMQTPLRPRRVGKRNVITVL